MGCFGRKKKVEPVDDAEDSEWVDQSERADADLNAERRGELLGKKELEEVHKAFAAAAGAFGVVGGGAGGGELSCSKLAGAHGEARGNPLAGRIFASFSERKDGTLTKEDWVAACCVLSSRGGRANKARTAFQVYDIDEDGFVDWGDLRGTLTAVLGRALSSQQVEQIVKRLMASFDANNDHRLTEDEFRGLLTVEDYGSRFTMDLY